MRIDEEKCSDSDKHSRQQTVSGLAMRLPHRSICRSVSSNRQSLSSAWWRQVGPSHAFGLDRASIALLPQFEIPFHAFPGFPHPCPFPIRRP